MILVRNVAEGLQGVSPAALDAADGLGYTRFARLVQVEIPLALPAIVGGIRIATVSLIGIATVAAWIDAGGLGTLVFEGLHQDDPDKIVAGSLAAVVLALAADGLCCGSLNGATARASERAVRLRHAARCGVPARAVRRGRYRRARRRWRTGSP